MRNNLSKFTKAFRSIASFSLILISNNTELTAKYLPSNEKEFNDDKINIQNINQYENDPISNFNFNDNVLIADNGESNSENIVLISEIIIKGWEDHPEGRKLELAAYDSMTIKPGNTIYKDELEKVKDFLKAQIFASGWFEKNINIETQDSPLGVRLIVNVVPNPILKIIELNPKNTIIPSNFVDDIFKNDYGTTLNILELEERRKLIKKWYVDKGYSLVRTNVKRITGDGRGMVLKLICVLMRSCTHART